MTMSEPLKSSNTQAAPSAYGYPLLLKHLFHSALRATPDREIVYRDVVRFDYRTLAARIAQLASALAGLGLRAGETVGVLDWDSHRYLESYFAVPGTGAVLHMVNIRLSAEQILYTINHAEDAILLVHTDFLPVLEEIWDRVTGVRAIVLLTDSGDLPDCALPIAGEYEALLAYGSPEFAFPDFDENTRATTFYTTGTTGLPKGVFFSHRQIVLHTLGVTAALGTSPSQGRFHRGDVYMPITPMFHVHAWGLPFVATMLGVKQVYPGRYTPETLLGLLRNEKVSFSHCVPTLLHMLLTHPKSAEVDMAGWKLIVGGSALSKGLARAALDRGIDVFTGYGMSETCPIIALSQLTPDMAAADADAGLEVRTRTGLPAPLVDLRIVDADMDDLPHDGRSTGEVVVRAPWLTQGYFKDPKTSETLWAGGYLHTGDIAHMRPDGYLQVTDRIKDVIKTGGEWISSLEIEDLLSRHPGVSEAAVIAVPDAKWGERPLAIIVARETHRESLCADGVRAHLRSFSDRGLISKWAVPETIVFVDTLAKTSVGKLDKKAMRSLHVED